MRRSRGGFTLIEVMVALTIVALSLTAIGASTNQMIDAANTMRERTYASWVAQNKITEMRLSEEDPEVRTTSGEVDFANVSWEWEAEVSETGIEDFYRVDVAVSLAGSDYIVRTVTGFLGKPLPRGAANTLWGRDRGPGPTEQGGVER